VQKGVNIIHTSAGLVTLPSWDKNGTGDGGPDDAKCTNKQLLLYNSY